MLRQTSKVLICQSQQSIKSKILNKNSQPFSKNTVNTQNLSTINTLKVDFAAMFKQKCTTDPCSRCQHCGAIMIQDQEEGVNGKQKQMMNQKNKEKQREKEKIEQKVKQYQKYQKDEEGNYILYCRFCSKQNKRKQVYFCGRTYKTVTQKNIQRGFLPPILVFLIDVSGSMGQSVSVNFEDQSQVNKKSNLMTVSKQILQIINSSSFRQKQRYKENLLKQKYRFDEQKDNENGSKNQKQQYFSKITLFMGIIENYLTKMKDQPELHQFRVAFVFFNQAIYIMKPAKQKLIPTFIDKNSKFKKDFPFERTVVDFYNYEELFNAGKKYERFFGDSRLKNCDLSKLMTQNIETQGQTALGPALSLALGITSVHDSGSRIILISDAMPNMGILSGETSPMNQKIYQNISEFLQLKQVTISILDWVTEQGKNYQEKAKSEFGQFLESNPQQIKQISLDFSLRQGHIEIINTARKTLQNLMKGGSLGKVFSIQIRTSSPKLQASKLKHDDTNFLVIRFLGLRRSSWIQLKLRKPSQQDLLFPVYTQIIVTYQDIFTKQKYLYMSYAKHKIISTNNNKQVYEYLDNSNQGNLKQLIDLQKIHNFDKQNVMLESVMSKNCSMNSMSFDIEKSKGQSWEQAMMMGPSLNSLAEIQNRRLAGEYSYCEDEDDDKL